MKMKTEKPPLEKYSLNVLEHTIWKNGKVYELLEYDEGKDFEYKHIVRATIDGRVHCRNFSIEGAYSYEDLVDRIEKKDKRYQERERNMTYEEREKMNSVARNIDKVGRLYDRYGDSHDFIGE
ncbi:MAG: hypothetical protein U9R34_05790 [Nanoarchaeota archaeon]|nr:hypothetical protein [Nanoarchaeota archaeon]